MKNTRKLKDAGVCLKQIRLGKIHAKDIGFPGLRNDGDGDLSRFIARWRLAANFTSVEINGFAAGALSGYAGIIKMVLAVNAAEQFARCQGIDVGHIVHLESTLKIEGHDIKWTQAMRRIFEMLETHLTGDSLRRRVSICLEKRSFDLWGFAFGVRHLFSHGILTAGANEADPGAVGSLCSKTANIILNSTELYFSSSVEKLQE